jgi:hypothetical protein
MDHQLRSERFGWLLQRTKVKDKIMERIDPRFFSVLSCRNSLVSNHLECICLSQTSLLFGSQEVFLGGISIMKGCYMSSFQSFSLVFKVVA